jgi:hypothetical protein
MVSPLAHCRRFGLSAACQNLIAREWVKYRRRSNMDGVLFFV